MRKTTIAGFVAAALIAAACGSSSVEDNGDPVAVVDGTAAAESNAPKAKTAKVGSTLTVKANGVTADWTLTKVQTEDADQFGMEPSNGGSWVLVHVKVAVTKGPEVFVCPCDLSIISTSGKVYEQGFASFKGHPDLTGATVAPGQNTDGWVIFDVASKDLKGARLQLKQASLLTDTAFGYWTLGLK